MNKINPYDFFSFLKKEGVSFYCGVPDSILKNFTIFVEKNTKKNEHIILANEGNAVATAVGYHLSTNRIPVVYMQNSGFGNCVNPLTSLTNKEVYSVPLILLIGWRGSPSIADEPQHRKPGRIMEKQLKLLGIKYVVLENKINKKDILSIISHSKKKSEPVAILVKENLFERIKLQKRSFNYKLKRKNIINCIVEKITNKELVFSTTGMISREIISSLSKKSKKTQNYFFNVGAMGHASSIAFGASLFSTKNIICIDGDGSFLMHMGSLAVIGEKKLKNFKYILINNGAHESVGGQGTVAFDIDIKSIMKSFGFNYFLVSKSTDELNNILDRYLKKKSPVCIEIKVDLSNNKDLPRPEESLLKLKKRFMSFSSNA